MDTETAGRGNQAQSDSSAQSDSAAQSENNGQSDSAAQPGNAGQSADSPGKRNRAGRRTLVFDAALIAALLLAAGLSYLLTRRNAAEVPEEQVRIRVMVEGQQDQYFPLYEDGVYPLNGGTNYLAVSDGWAWMSEADCPDKLCMHQGKIRKNGQWVICLPNRVAFTIEGGEDAEWDEILG